MKSVFCLTVLLINCLCSFVNGEVYDNFNDKEETWKFPVGNSPNGKWSYEYGKNGDWATLVEKDGSLWFQSVQSPGHSITSTEVWDMPARPGESLTFTLGVTNFFYNKESTFREHWIQILGDVTSFGVFVGWKTDTWTLQDQWYTDTTAKFPNDMKWQKVKITFYRTKDNVPMWRVQIEKDKKIVYSVDRQLYNEWGTNKTAQLRMRSNFARARYDFVAVDAVRAPEAASPTKGLRATLTAPASVFRDEDLRGTISISVRPKMNFPGAIYLKYTGRKNFLTILDSRFTGKGGERKDYSFVVPSFDFSGQSGELAVMYRDKSKTDTILTKQYLNVYNRRLPRPGENVLTNASFELGSGFLGTRLGYNDIFMISQGWEGRRTWTSLPLDGWWLDEGKVEQAAVVEENHSGKKSLRIDAGKGKTSVVSTLGQFIPPGVWTLSAYVKTKGVKGLMTLDFVTGVRQAKEGQAKERFNVNLPANTTEWTRITVMGKSSENLIPFVHLEAQEGTVLIDDVQLEMGQTATAFNVKPEEYLRVSFGGQPDEVMPKWINSDTDKRTFTVTNDSRIELKGKITVRFGPWTLPDVYTLGQFEAADLKPGQTKEFTFSTENLRVDGYIASVELKGGGFVVANGLWDFDPYAYTNFGMQNALHSRSVARFIVVSRIEPTKLFGIGNTTMVKTGAQDSRSYLEQHLPIREIGMSCIRGATDDNESFMSAAVGGVPIYAQAEFDSIPANCTFANPCNPGRFDVYCPEGREYLKKSGEDLGRQLGANPLVAGIQLANEQFWVNGHTPCPTKAADENFRAWCRKQHGDLKALNERWGTAYTNWDQVDQVISEGFYKRLIASRKDGAAGLSWGGMIWGNTWPKEGLAEMNRLPGKTMDWLRWRTETGVGAYKAFRDAAKQFDKKTLYSTDLPIATFAKQFFIPFGRAMDAVMVNVRYTSGYENSFGTPHENMSILEMGESIATEQNKPFWGIEVYYKPFWPGEAAALQNWGLIAHGMSVPLIFAWYPKTDREPITDVLAWEEKRNKKVNDPFERACWYLVDADGAYMPAYDPYVRSLKEVKKYHENYDGTSIKRTPTDVAYYISNDSCELATFETGHAGWGAVSERVCYTLIYLLRMHGITADFVDDVTLPDKPEKYKAIVVPLSPVLNQASAQKIADFARAGGTVVLVGASGRKDPWLRKYDMLGGPVWADLNWRAPEYKESFGAYRFDLGVSLPKEPGLSATDTAGKPNEARDLKLNENKIFRGLNFGTVAGAEPIQDKNKKLIGWQRSWGKGKLVAYGICPDTWTSDPHPTPHLAAWTQQMINTAGLKSAGRWITTKSEISGYGAPGTGSPAVDLVVRVKSPAEKFIFALNQGGAGKGIIEIPVDMGNWSAEDVIHPGKKIEGKIENGVWRTEVLVGTLGYQVIKLARPEK